ncbi:MAG TPA: hypothetical protein VE093_08330 [Polyangiaceae bacterium]|nr:hypothetical protein [Polyangiaceae bacterium]
MTLFRRSFFTIALGLLAASGCSGSDTPTGSLPPPAVPEGCNPIAYEGDCLLPYPSDVFLVDDASTPSRKRVQFTPQATLETNGHEPVDFLKHHPADGFSRVTPILAVFPEGVSDENLTFHTDDPAATRKADSPTVVLDAETGELIAHWAELDKNTDIAKEQALFVRPFAKLKEKRRYIVAFQGLKDRQGSLLKAPNGFAHILAKETGADPKLKALADRYESSIFPALEKAGVARAALQLAWDFTTGSDEMATRDMLAVRDDVIAKLEATPPAVTITAVLPDHNEEIGLRIEGTIRVPLYLANDQPGAMLHRGADGKVTQNGEAEVPFTLQVPKSALPADASFEPARILQYGHGFFGLREEIDYGYMRGFSLEQKYITIAVDWWGMSEPDQFSLTNGLLNDPGSAFTFTDRLHQAMANMIALSYAVKGPLTEQGDLQRFDKLLYDPDKLYYYGISQGAIFGVTLLSLSPTLDRAAFSVGGGPYSLMMTRSASYTPLFALVEAALPGPLAIQKFTALTQTTWDRVDPMTYSERVLLDPYPKSPAERRILMQIGVGDHSVNNLASYINARAMGMKLLDPSPRAIHGLDPVSAPAESALVIVDFKLASEPGVDCRLPTEDEKNDVHEDVRRNAKIKMQLDAFFQPDGTIQNFCDGPCDPE